MPLNWINPEDFSFNSFLLMDRFQIRMMLKTGDWHTYTEEDEKAEKKRNLGVALNANPAVKWYMEHKCPECADIVREIAANAPALTGPAEIRKAEVAVLASSEDWVTYTRPEVMDTNCDFICAWNKERLFELADFTGKTVLDVGSGSGRLAFAAAEKAAWVYASEPVDTLREYLRDKIGREGIRNMHVVDGMAHALAYPDDTFDIVMSGHVVGDDYDNEIAEMSRVCKPGGWFLDCPGENANNEDSDSEMTKRGWEEMHYISPLGGDVYRYRKQIMK